MKTLHFLNLEEFTDLINGCAPDALVRKFFVILCVVATVRYLHLKAQELHDALIDAHTTFGDDLEEKDSPWLLGGERFKHPCQSSRPI